MLATDTRDHRPVADVLGLKIPELPVRLVAPAQEPTDHTGPLLERRWCEAALIAHPSHILIELALMLEPGTRFTPPTEKSKPRSSDIDHSSRRGDGSVGLLPLNGNTSKCLDVDALRRSIRAETQRNPQQLVALYRQRSASRPAFRTVAKVTVPLFGKRRVIMVVAGRMAGISRVIHSKPPLEKACYPAIELCCVKNPTTAKRLSEKGASAT